MSSNVQSVPALLQRAFEHHRRDELAQARALCERALRLDLTHIGGMQLLASILAQSGEAGRAVQLLARAAALNPRDARTWCFKGAVHQQLAEHAHALPCYERAIALDPTYTAAYLQRGAAAAQLGHFQTALASYDRAVALDPRSADALCNRGIVLRELGRLGEALASFDRAIELNPDLAQAHYNRGNLLRMVWKLEPALAAYERALELQPNYRQALHNRANTLLDLGRFEAATEDYARARALGDSIDFLPGALRFARMQLCDWRDLERDLEEFTTGIERGARMAPPLPLLALVDSPALHRKAASIWAEHRRGAVSELPPMAPRPRQPRIRLGYFSTDLHEHPVARQIIGLLEAHDRARFEVVVFSLGPNIKDALRERILAAADRFLDMSKRSDRYVAQLSREIGVDIAIDLSGYTQGSRVGIFMLRAAPVQMSYIGYLGTQGDFIDYLVADRTLVPEVLRPHYAENIIILPSYQVNDPKRPAALEPRTRRALDVPAGAFLYCCFNSCFKITPATFGSWMRILARVEKSVLMLNVERPPAKDNLRRCADAAGVDPERLLFAQRLAIPDYLARLRAADLFLDTWPYNAGTTASDALWAGLPVLTCAGQSFASRIAASLLEAVDLPQLITTTAQAYEDLAVELACNASLLAGMRRTLEAGRGTAVLFDAARFARHFEAACTQAHERYHAGLAPVDLVI